MYEGKWDIWKISVPPSQFQCKLKTALKIQSSKRDYKKIQIKAQRENKR